MSYEIHLPVFEGPFDLLLFFIERDELDIYDIPIAQITREFMQYLSSLEALDMEVASEFILVAATLMRIKAKMLLPRQELDAEGNVVDPRKELVQQLLEYKRAKPLMEKLTELEAQMLGSYKRGNAGEEYREIALKMGMELDEEDVDLYKLVRAYQAVMSLHERREEERKIQSIIPYPYTVSGQKDYLLTYLREEKQFLFSDFVQQRPDKVLVVFTFLAILDLLQVQKIKIQLTEGFNNFYLALPKEGVV